MWQSMRDIIVFGHDPRMESVAGYFYHLGYDVYENPEDAVADACVITAPKLSETEEDALCAYVTDDQILYHGLLSGACLQKLQENGVTCKPYLQMEKLVTENAQLTARGILSIAGRDAVLLESHCLVLGYGHCGKAIADALVKAGAHVDVAVRRKELKSEIEQQAYGYLNLSQWDRYAYDKYSYVFNTIPAMVLDAGHLQWFSPSILIYDIASSPGGTDFAYCKAYGIRADIYLGIPGKLYPKEAGRVIASGIYEHALATETPSD